MLRAAGSLRRLIAEQVAAALSETHQRGIRRPDHLLARLAQNAGSDHWSLGAVLYDVVAKHAFEKVQAIRRVTPPREHYNLRCRRFEQAGFRRFPPSNLSSDPLDACCRMHLQEL